MGCSSLFVFVYLCIYVFVYLCICVFVYLCICVFVYLVFGICAKGIWSRNRLIAGSTLEIRGRLMELPVIETFSGFEETINWSAIELALILY